MTKSKNILVIKSEKPLPPYKRIPLYIRDLKKAPDTGSNVLYMLVIHAMKALIKASPKNKWLDWNLSVLENDDDPIRLFKEIIELTDYNLKQEIEREQNIINRWRKITDFDLSTLQRLCRHHLRILLTHNERSFTYNFDDSKSITIQKCVDSDTKYFILGTKNDRHFIRSYNLSLEDAISLFANEVAFVFDQLFECSWDSPYILKRKELLYMV